MKKSMKKGKKAGWSDAADDAAKLWLVHQYFIARKAAADPTFRALLKSNPAEALRRIGIGVPKGAKVAVVETSPKMLYIALPPEPGAVVYPGVEISEETLKASGEFDTFILKDDFDFRRKRDAKIGNNDGSQDPKGDSDMSGDAGGQD
jgi:hypothetical protein